MEVQVDFVHLSGCKSGWRVSAASVCSQTRALILPIMRLTSTFILGQSLLQGAYSNILAGPGISKTKGNLVCAVRSDSQVSSHAQ